MKKIPVLFLKKFINVVFNILRQPLLEFCEDVRQYRQVVKGKTDEKYRADNYDLKLGHYHFLYGRRDRQVQVAGREFQIQLASYVENHPVANEAKNRKKFWTKKDKKILYSESLSSSK